VEQCDDANANNADACLTSCQVASCGDGFVQVGVEQCDDANPSNADTCLNSCQVASCGDGFTQTGVEQCDDGNPNNADACLNSCQAASCGDGFTQTGIEQCDDGNASNADACLSSCVAAACGDGFLQLGIESCDDGNTVTEACSYGQTSCTVCDAVCNDVPGGTSFCGDGSLDPIHGEQCDDGNATIEACAYGQTSCVVCSSSCLDAPGATSFCGDGLLDTAAGEQCDDANSNNADGCLNDCSVASCGDGFVQIGVEQCDDANADNTDACLDSCQAASCGDGFVRFGVEECDDANPDNTDTCLNTCVAATCGDGFVRAGIEQCDDANPNNSDACLDTCQAASCGDGFVQVGVEECDDANPSNGDACLNSCQAASCGDGFVQVGVEQCDDANPNNTDACLDSCSVASCGDGFLHAGFEQCDDGNASNGDACLNSCMPAACGDGIVWLGVEQCDDANEDDTDACLSSCVGASCGDGVRWRDVEACDDGNVNNSDLCLNSCQIASCGDGFVQSGVEQCDDANANDGDACLNTCVSAACGDGFLWVGVEQCDDANTFTESCTYGETSCVVCDGICSQVPGATSFCGDAAVDGSNGEVCDDGNSNNSDACLDTCVPATCGDGVVQVGTEQCDDANANNSDGCIDTCAVASCGDGYVRAGVEQCDDGNGSNADACLTSCVSATCGDGWVRSGVEACDDGNTALEECAYGQTSCLVCNEACSQVLGATSFCGDGLLDAPNGEYCDDANSNDDDGCLDVCAFQRVPALANLLDGSGLSPPSPDSAGLAFRSDASRLVMTDSEVNETPIYENVNIWQISTTGNVLDTGSTTPFNDPGEEEPTGVAYNPSNGHYFITNDDLGIVWEVDPGADGRPGTPDDTESSFDTEAFGSFDPEGVAFDTLRGFLYIADGGSSAVFEVRPGPNGVFDGVPPAGDDQVSWFDTDALGVSDPEGVEHDPVADRLYVVGNGDHVVLETTTSGALVRRFDLDGIQGISLAGVTLAPASDDPDVQHLYIADRGLDNNGDPNESDGRVYEVTLEDEPGLVVVRVDSSSDDAEEGAAGAMSLNDAALEMVLNGSLPREPRSWRRTSSSRPKPARPMPATS
jgi:cysteine-rich repeat protein